jgi:hypothetical protein
MCEDLGTGGAIRAGSHIYSDLLVSSIGSVFSSGSVVTQLKGP